MTIFALFTILNISFANHSLQTIQLSEKQKIEYLIQSISQLEGAQFYRNGKWYSASEAADHLRLKLKNSGNRIKTARQFIEHIASKSSMSGISYKIRFRDGKTMESWVFLNQQLRNIE